MMWPFGLGASSPNPNPNPNPNPSPNSNPNPNPNPNPNQVPGRSLLLDVILPPAAAAMDGAQATGEAAVPKSIGWERNQAGRLTLTLSLTLTLTLTLTLPRPRVT